MPASFGNFMFDTNQDGVSTCKSSSGDSFVATCDPGKAVETSAAHLVDTERAGKWTYGKDSYDMFVCLTEPYSNTVATLTFDRPFATLTGISGSFLEAW